VIPEDDLDLIRDVVRQAGAIAKAAFEANDSKRWNKADSSPVTEADIAVNDFLLDTLRAARPGYGWLSEETKDDHSRHACPRTFVVDPIDGTRAFIDRTPNFAVCVAVIEKGRSIAGVVYNPLKDEMYEAFLGGGARLNGETITASNPAKIAGIRMIGYPRKFRKLDFPDMNVSVANSMAYRMCLVASGNADATIAFTPKSDWDVAAASLIATEAGAIVSNIRGEIGGELVDPNRTEFKDLTAVDYVGAYPNFEAAHKAWKSAAQRTVDNAHMRYFILHAHDLLDPDGDGVIG